MSGSDQISIGMALLSGNSGSSRRGREWVGNCIGRVGSLGGSQVGTLLIVVAAKNMNGERVASWSK